MRSENSASSSPNSLDKTAMYLDSHELLYSMALGTITAAAGIGAGLYVDSKFINNHLYEAKMYIIDQVSATQARLEQANHTLQQYDITSANHDSNQLDQSYTTIISQLRTGLPSNYHPNLEITADVFSALLSATLVSYSLFKAVQHYSNRGDRRTVTSSQLSQTV